MLRKVNPCMLLVGMQTGAATLENSIEFPQKVKNGTAFWLSNPLLGICPNNHKVPIQKNICNPMFIATLFTIAKVWKQPKCPSVGEWIKKLWDICTMEHYSAAQRRKSYLLWHMDESGKYYAKWNKQVRERQIPYDLTYMWNLMSKRETEAWTHGRHWQLSDGRGEGRLYNRGWRD